MRTDLTLSPATKLLRDGDTGNFALHPLGPVPGSTIHVGQDLSTRATTAGAAVP